MSKGNKEEQKWLLGESLNQYDRSLKEELSKVEKRNREQNHKISALINAFDDDYIKKEEENTNISLDYSKEGIVIVDDIKGNTLVNNVKDSNKKLVLNGDIDTQGINNVTLEGTVDNGKVDVSLEGNTMVNVCDQEDPIAITKNYEVTTGNHIALQGEYDGKCRPNIYGNTIVSWQDSKDINKGQQVTINKQYETKSIHTLHTTVGDKVYFRIKFTVDEMNTTSAEPKIFTGYSMGYKIDVKAFKDCTVGKIEEASTIREHESARTDQTHMDLCIGMYAPMPDDVPAGSAVCKYTMHDYVIYNLTQLFGAGKEPAQEWCDKNLPYLEGMQSSFEDKLITDEKDAHNGKYKVDYKVTGKNKCRIKDGNYTNNVNTNGLTWTIKDNQVQINGTSTGMSSLGTSMCYPNFINGKTYVTSTNNSNVTFYISYTDNGTKKYSGGSNKTYTHNSNYTDIMCYLQVNASGITFNNEVIKCQLEEGTKATTYEPYKEYTKTLYLNSPLLEGDTIEQSGNDIVHMHRYNKVVLDGSDDEILESTPNDKGIIRQGFSIEKNNLPLSKFVANDKIGNFYCDKLNTASFSAIYVGTVEGICLWCSDNNTQQTFAIYKGFKSVQEFRTWLQQNPITIVYELQTPTREVISTNDNLLLDSYVNGHLDVDSVIPIDKVVFQSYGTSLKYLSPNTEYTIQFESDSNGKLDALALNSSDVIGNLNIVKGVNNFNITTSDKITINYLWTTGIGFNASKIVVTPKVDQDFGYFKAMKSVGQDDENGHKIEILSSNSDNTLSNKKEILMNEPLRGLPNGVRDKYVMIDGKWYIEKNTKQSNMSELDFAGDTNDTVKVLLFNNAKPIAISNIFSNHYDYNSITKGQMYIQERDGGLTYAWIPTDSMSNEEFKRFLNEKNAIIIYQLATPTYEPIDYNPFEVYSDITHISNNSIIPCNMVIKNSGYNCILKPNTKYTVVTNTQNSISAKIGSAKVDSTNNVFTIITPSTLTDSVLRFSGKGLTTKNIMLLEGDKTNYIPGYFTGMESAFEQELVTDEKDKNYGKYKVTAKVTDGNKENNITFYINEPLRGIGDIKDKIYVKEDKIVVERNCVSYVIEPTQIPSWASSSNGIYTYNLSVNSPIVNTNRGRVVCNSFPCDVKNAHIRNYANSISTVVDPSVPNGVIRIITDKDPETLKQWLQANPTTVIYQLATPTYEEVECNLSKLMLENYENSSLILNSNIPPTIGVRYKGELPIVSATKELSSNVESTTIDINQNIIPYMCDMDYRIVELQLKNASTQGLEVNVLGLDSEDVLFNNRKANKIFNPSYEMLKRDILSERYSSDEYKYRLERYLLADKISNEEYNELEELIVKNKL